VTLVLSMATPIFVVQVADRRLTFVEANGNTSLADDNTNKLTLFCNRMAFGYTGLASIGGRKTDVWLSYILSKFSGLSLNDAILEIKKEATAEFAKLTHYSSKVKRHAFIGAGWACASVKPLQFHPMMCRISNFHDDKGKVLASARSEFGFSYVVYEPPKWGWLETGTGMYPGEIARLHRLLNRAARRGASDVDAVRLMVSAIRNVSARDKTVGKDLLAIMMPSTVAGADSVRVLTGDGTGMFIGDDLPSFKAPTIESVFLPDGKATGIIYAPNLACNGTAILGMRAGPLSK